MTPSIRLCALLLAALLFTGCNGALPLPEIAWPGWWPFQNEVNVLPASLPSGQSSDGSGAPPPSPANTLYFHLWAVSPAEEAFLREQVEAFAAQHPGPAIELKFTVDYDRSLLDPAPGEPSSDLFLVTGFNLPSLIAANQLSPVPPQFDRTESVTPTLLPGFAVGARAFCLPRDVHTLALAYNPALFDRAQTAYPTPAWQWTDFAAAAEAVTDEDFFLFALTLNPDLSRIAPFMFQAGGGWVDTATGSAIFDSPASQAGIDFFIELFRAGSAVYDTTLDGIWPGEAFGRGSAGMTIEGSWLLPYVAQEFPRFEYETVELPRGPAGPATLAFTTCLGVNPNSAHRTHAYALAEFLTRPDIAAAWREYHGGMPVYPDELAAWASLDPRRQPFASGVAYARVWQLPLGWQHVPEVATPIIRSVIAGEQTVESLAQRLQAATQTQN